MSLDSAVYEDGQTQHGYIAAAPGLYPAVRFQYRPLLISDRRALWTEQERRGDQDTPVMEALVKKVVSWDVKDGKGVTLNAKDPATYQRLKPKLFDRLFMIVLGNQASDPDPQAPDEPKKFDEAGTAKN